MTSRGVARVGVTRGIAADVSREVGGVETEIVLFRRRVAILAVIAVVVSVAAAAAAAGARLDATVLGAMVLEPDLRTNSSDMLLAFIHQLRNKRTITPRDLASQKRHISAQRTTMVNLENIMSHIRRPCSTRSNKHLQHSLEHAPAALAWTRTCSTRLDTHLQHSLGHAPAALAWTAASSAT